jgi:hypothetical protein
MSQTTTLSWIGMVMILMAKYLNTDLKDGMEKTHRLAHFLKDLA